MKQNLSSPGYDSPQKKLSRLAAVTALHRKSGIGNIWCIISTQTWCKQVCFLFSNFAEHKYKKKSQETLFVFKLIHHSNTNQSINLSLSVNLLLCKDIVKRHCLRLGFWSYCNELDRVASLIPLEKTSLKYVNRQLAVKKVRDPCENSNQKCQSCGVKQAPGAWSTLVLKPCSRWLKPKSWVKKHGPSGPRKPTGQTHRPHTQHGYLEPTPFLSCFF